VSNRNVGFTLPGGLTAVLKHLKKKSRKTLKVFLIIAGLIPFLFTKPVIAQVRTAVPQTSVVPAATQMPTDEATQKRIEELIAQLGDKNWRVRRAAIDALGKIGDPQAVQPLIKALSDRDLRVRQSAANALGEIGNPQAVEALIKALEDENWFVRQSAIKALGKTDDPQAIQSLIKALIDRDSRVRVSAARTLGEIGDPQAVQPLIKALSDRDLRVRQSAADALGETGRPAIQPLIKALEDENSSLRLWSAEALGRIGDPQAVQPLIKALSDRNSRVRISAARTLGQIGDPQAVQSLINALSDRNGGVCISAADALGKIGQPAIHPLIKALEDENSSVRLWAAYALGEIGDPQAVQPLIKALEDESGPVRESAADALGEIDDPQAEKVARKRALARKAREVLFVLIKLLTPCLPIFLFVGLGLVLKYKGYITANVARAISIYPTLVIGNVIFPLKFIILGLAYPSFGLLWTLGGRWLSITTGGFLVLVYEYDLGGPYGHKEMYYLLSLAYSAVFFLPLFGYLFFKKRNAKITCALVQFVFIICHAAVIYILITRYDLVKRMIDIIRY